ncbi:MAG: LysR family transcriptional regulator [Myxococcota bacterium]
MNLSSVDLNLLVYLDALLIECHVTKAGRRMGLSQSAMSRALGRLRDLFEDELLIKSAHGMTPTPLAKKLKPHVAQILRDIDGLLEGSRPFDPTTDERTFTLIADEYANAALVPSLMARIQSRAPRVQLRARSLDDDFSPDSFVRHGVDVAIGSSIGRADDLVNEVLLQERFVCVVRAGHPLAENLTLDAYLRAGHVRVATIAQEEGHPVDHALSQKDRTRDVRTVVPHVLMTPSILQTTDLIATLPSRLASLVASQGSLTVTALPLKLAGFDVSMLWHKRFDEDDASRWLRSLLREVVQAR